MQIKLLENYKALDLTRLYPGPKCTQRLADMGMKVVKIEALDGDYVRHVPPLQNVNSSFFLGINRNKSSIALNLKTPEGVEIFKIMAQEADVVVESFRPGVVDGLGIGYEDIIKEKPDIVYCSITGYGQTGPKKDDAGHDLNYIANAGVIRDTSIPSFQIADVVAGLDAATAILAALLSRKETGQGRYIDVSIMDSVLASSDTKLARTAGTDMNSVLFSGNLPCCHIYETSDQRFVVLSALEPKFWENFCRAAEKEHLIPKHFIFGQEAQDVIGELSTMFKDKSMDYWINKFKNVDCCFSPALTFEEALEDEHVQAREMVIREDHPYEGPVTYLALPMKFKGLDFQVEKPAPMLGEHTDEILRELGYSDTSIAELRAKNVIG